MKSDLQDVADALPHKADREPRLAGKPTVRKLPDGRVVSDLSREDLNAALKELGIPGAIAGNSREAAVALYSQHLQKIYDENGKEGVGAWMFINGDDSDESDDDSEKDDDE
jgi:hypothetical protein